MSPKLDWKPPQRHHKFYFDDGNVVFQVEDTLFNIHRYFFQRDSPIFNAMFSLPQPSPPRQQELDVIGNFVELEGRSAVTTTGTPEREGDSDNNPIILTGFKAEDFTCLLEIMYPASFYMSLLVTQSQWISVLDMSTRFEFSSIRRLAIHRLHMLISNSAIDSIVLGKRFDVPEWLVPSYQSLCVRQQSLSIEEGKRLGLGDVIAIAHVRQSIRYAANLNRHTDSISELVRQTFLEEANA